MHVDLVLLINNINNLTKRIGMLLCAIVVLLVWIVVLVWSWNTWTDPLVDFGRELYTPWRLTQGDVLYRDIAWFNGPLSPIINAVFYSVGGVSYRTLVVANIVLTTLLIIVISFLIKQFGSWLSSVCAALLFITVFACSQYISVSNYNYITPYSHELTHGILASLSAILAFSYFLRTNRNRWILITGIMTGIVLLTKVEVSLALLCSLLAAWILSWCTNKDKNADLRFVKLRHQACIFLAASFLLPVLAVIILATQLPISDAIVGTLGSWRYVFNSQLHELRFYREGAGLIEPLNQLLELLKMLGWWLAVFVPVFVIALLPQQNKKWQYIIAGTIAWMVPYILWQFPSRYAWLEVARPLPVILLALLFWQLIVRRNLVACKDEKAVQQSIIAVTFIVFSLLLLSKMLLHTRVYHYGFALAMPAAMVIVVAIIDWIPNAISKSKRCGYIFRIAAISALTVLMLKHLNLSQEQFRQKNVTLGYGADSFLVGGRGVSIAAAIDDLAEVIRERQGSSTTFAVLPEGVMFNYQLRKLNPTGFVNFMPPEFIMFGEEVITDAFKLNPPDFIVLVPKGTSEYGMGDFGHGYALELMQWVNENYQELQSLGGNTSGIQLLELADRE